MPNTIIPSLFPLNLADTSPLHHTLILMGRTHVLLIHFPIALLLMAALGELNTRLRGRESPWTLPTLLCGTLGAAAATTMGWMLLWFGETTPSTELTQHQYLGTATAALALITATLHWQTPARPKWWLTTSILLTAALVTLTAHLGGTLVHGNLFAP